MLGGGRPDGYVTTLQSGHLSTLTDNAAQTIRFHFNPAGLLESLEGPNGKKAKYSYGPQQDLLHSRDVDGHEYTYRYDALGKHNLVGVREADGTAIEIDYYDATLFGNVKSVKERDGTREDYGYQRDPADPLHWTVSVVTRKPDVETVSTATTEYFDRKSAQGGTWTYRIIFTRDGERTDTTYTEVCGLPLRILRGNDEALFQYDEIWRLVRKETPLEIKTLAYHPSLNKIIRVRVITKADGVEEWFEYQYDYKGNLTSARASGGRELTMSYDEQSRIVKIVRSEPAATLGFKYNEQSKPVEISLASVGSMFVTYGKNQEVLDTRSSNGRAIALQVTQVFQALQDMIRPAEVQLF